MRDLTRPALADALAAITTRPVGHWRAELGSPALVGLDRISSRDVQWSVRVEPHRSTTQTRRASLRQTEPVREARRVGNTLVAVETEPAHTITPREAVEVLAGLWPWAPEEGPRWWCEACGGAGTVRCPVERRVVSCEACGSWNDEVRATVDGPGHTADPPSHAALVAVASLGVERLRAAEGLAQEIAAHAGRREARLAWRVMGREAIEMHHARERGAWWSRLREHGGAIDPTLPEVFSTEENISHWRSELRWRSRTMGRAAWPALRALRDLGLHLVALDASRIVLAVEAIGGDRG